jgi:uncharacterized membrane protein HdeD (DUF308 family)
MATMTKASLILGYVFIAFGVIFIPIGVWAFFKVGSGAAEGIMLPGIAAIAVGIIRIIRVKKALTQMDRPAPTALNG